MEDGDDAYKVLGVKQDATQSEIKKAYRKLGRFRCFSGLVDNATLATRLNE